MDEEYDSYDPRPRQTVKQFNRLELKSDGNRKGTRNLRVTSQCVPVPDLHGNSWWGRRWFAVPEEIEAITRSTKFGFVAGARHIAI